MRAELAISLKSYRISGNHILIVGQIPKDASLRGVDIVVWLQETSKAVRRVSDRPVIVRLHPSTRWRDQERVIEACRDLCDVTVSRGEGPISDDLEDCWACVTLSSGAAIDALIAGIPPICLSPASLAYEICSNFIEDVEHPKTPDRDQFLRDICYSQWSLGEMADGTVWRHILPAVERALARSGSGPSDEYEFDRDFSAVAPENLCNSETYRSHGISGRFSERRKSFLMWTTAAATLLDGSKLWISRAHALLAGHEGVARSAEKSGRWDCALEAWTEAHELSPDRISPLAGRARALLELHREAEAKSIFAGLCENHPLDPTGFHGLASLATQQRNWPLVLAMYGELWERFGDVDAIRMKVLLLVRLQCFADARRVVESLRPPKTSTDTYLLAAMPYLEAVHDWAAIERIAQEYETSLLRNWDLVHSYVGVLARLGRADDALEVIDRSPAGKVSSRQTLRTIALIRAHRFGEANEFLRCIWESKELGNIPSELLSPLTIAAWEAGGFDLASFILDRIDAESPSNKAGEMLRLLAPFQRARLRCLAGLFSTPSRLETFDLGIEQELVVLLADRPALPQAQPTYGPVREICDLFVRLRGSRPAFFPDPSFVLTDALEIAARIVEAVDARKPFSTVRLGDGEGSLLPYRQHLESFREADKTATQRTWWGERRPFDTDLLEEELRASIRSADIVGLPDLDRVCRTMLSHPINAIRDGGRNARGLLASIDFAVGNVEREGVTSSTLTSCHIHQSLLSWGLWDLLLPRIGPLSLITCHAELERLLVSRYGVSIDETYLVPPERKFAMAFRGANDGRHYPDAFEELRMRLSDIKPGQVFLVAAGVMGKLCCMQIKQSGGIAIDIGSAADFWCGFETRGITDVAIYNDLAGMLDRLRGILVADPRFSMLLCTRL